jgi:ankyrin repeat protein
MTRSAILLPAMARSSTRRRAVPRSCGLAAVALWIAVAGGWVPARLPAQVSAPSPGGATRPALSEDHGTQTVPQAPWRAAVERSLPLLQSSMERWITQRDCSSCHHQGLGLMALSLVEERGFAVERSAVARQLEHLVSGDAFVLTDWFEGIEAINPSFGNSFLALGEHAVGLPTDGRSAARAHFLAGQQAQSGAWLSESHRPPLEAAAHTATAFAVRVLRLHSVPTRAEDTRRRVVLAREWLRGAAALDQEQRAMRLLGLYWTDAEDEELAAAAAALLAQQQADGSWSQLDGGAGDAYATGQALTVLQQTGQLDHRAPAFTRGLAFLLAGQRPDGSWHVSTRRTGPGLPYFDAGYPHGEDQFLSFAAGAWATMALALGLDPRPTHWVHGNANAPLPAERTDPFQLPQPHRAAAFGTVEELTALLDAGAPVDEPGPELLTPLMFAVHDPAKWRLLLERGASHEPRTRRGFTPLSIAAWHSGAEDLVQALLERGADPGAMAFGEITPLYLAARTGNRRSAAHLLDAGAPLEAVAYGEVTPLLQAVFNDDVELVRLLLDRGAQLDRLYGGESALHIAAADGKEQLLALLLARGAAVDQPDGEGATPLTVAAGSNCGHGRIVAALLAAGADPQHRCAAGLTPLDWAERARNQSAIALLRRALGL